MEIGKLNQRITILESRTIIDEIGNHTSKWDEIFSCWTCVSVQSSKESEAAGVTKETQVLKFLIRQNSATSLISTTANRLAFRGTIYDIESIVPSFEKRDYLTLTATAKKAGASDEFC